jgi:hypothetical protein
MKKGHVRSHDMVMAKTLTERHSGSCSSLSTSSPEAASPDNIYSNIMIINTITPGITFNKKGK